MALTVAIEGLPGAGKSTVIGILVKKLRRRGFKVEVVDIETIGYAPEVREITRVYPLGNRIRIMLFWVLRIQQYEVMQALSDADIIFADRFMGSTLAFDAHGNGVPSEILDWLCEHIKHQPDITILLDVPLAVVRQRKDAKTMEDDEFARRVEQGYQKLADAMSWIRVDATQPPNRVARRCLDIMFSKARASKDVVSA